MPEIQVGNTDCEIDLRAIARVHRIGQHQATTVWMYIVEDTVEKSIYDISVTRRLAHIGRSSGTMERRDEASLENKIDAANTMELEDRPLGNLLAKGSSGGEVVGTEDLWNCLFQYRVGHGRSHQDAAREMVGPVGVTGVTGVTGGTGGEGRQDWGGQPVSVNHLYDSD